MLRYNEHGGAIIRQSDLSSWARCNLQAKYRAEALADPDGPQPKTLSATAYGTVMHYALMLMEKLHFAGKEDALDVAIATFEHFWHPSNITQLTDYPVDTWLPRQTYTGLRERGRIALTAYYDILVKDTGKLLALEYQFAVPMVVNGRQHTITGTVDRLALRKYYGTAYLDVSDFKTGRQPYYLRHNTQGTVYAWASTQPQFWLSDDLPCFPADVVEGLERALAKQQYRLHEGTKTDWWSGVASAAITPLVARRFRWINMQEIKFADAGWRGPVDYHRLFYVVEQYVAAVETGIYQPTLTGEVCEYCDFRTTCLGVGIGTAEHGQPIKRYDPEVPKKRKR